jgi:hypothetical protein
MTELDIEYTDIRDEPMYQRDGTVLVQKRATFYIGKFGPFTERLPADDNFTIELQRRAEALRRNLQGLPR